MAGPNDLIINAGVNPAGIPAGLQAAMQELDRFYAKIQASGSKVTALDISAPLAKISTELQKTGADMNAFFGNMISDLQAGAAQFKEGSREAQVFLGIIDQVRAEQASLPGFQSPIPPPAEPSMRSFERTAHATARTLGVLAASSIGVEGPIGRLAELALAATGGIGAVAVVSVVVIAAAKAWELFTKGQREAAKATEENRKALQHLQEQQKGPVVAAQTSFDTQRLVVEETSRKLAQASKVGAPASAALISAVEAGRTDEIQGLLPLIQRQAELTKELRGESELLAVAERALSEAERERQRVITAAGFTAVEQQIANQDRVRKAIEATQQGAVDAQAKLAAQTPPTFSGSQPSLVSDQELAGLRDRTRLTQQASAADIASLETLRRMAQQNLQLAIQQQRLGGAEGDAGRVAAIQAQQRIDELTAAITARRIEGTEQQRAIARELELLRITRQRTLEEKRHSERVTAAGGGNIIGANPDFGLLPTEGDIRGLRPIIQSQLKIPLPTPEDVERLRKLLQAVIPTTVGPSALDFEQARKAAIAPILQGSIQAGTQRPDIGLALDKTQAQGLAQEMTRVKAEIIGAAGAALHLGGAFESALGSALGIAQAIGAIKAANVSIGAAKTPEAGLAGQIAKISAIGGVITAGIGLLGGIIGSLFGKDAVQQEHDRILEENTRALRERTISEVDLGKINAQQATKAIEALARSKDLGLAGFLGTQQESIGGQNTVLNKFLSSFGVSLDQVLAIAEKAGITLEDSAGRIIPEAVKRFAAAILSGKISIEDLTKATNEATAAMRNVPEGFRIERFRFAAQTPEPVTVTPPTQLPGGEKIPGGRSDGRANFNVTVKINGKEVNSVVQVEEEKASMVRFGHPDGASRGGRWPQ